MPSWSSTTNLVKTADHGNILEQLEASGFTGGGGLPESQEAYQEAIEIAATAVVGGKIGDPATVAMTVTVAGFSNPNHQSDGSTEPDWLAIRIFQTP